jgi:hypothetical protein
LNKNTIEARQTSNTEFGLSIQREIADWETKGYSHSAACNKVKHKIDQWDSEQKALESDRTGYANAEAMMNKMGGLAAGSLGNAELPLPNKRMKGRDFCPLQFREEDLKAVHKAMERGENIRIKAFSTVDPLLPPELFPSIIAKIHEHRLLDHLPVIGMSAPSIEFLVHQSSTGGPPAITAEGALKPDVTLNFVSSTVTAQKIAAAFGLSWETSLDFPNVIAYAQGEVMKQIRRGKRCPDQRI